MTHMRKRDILWRKAAVLGSLWAASEIVLGSFLHNAHIPFSGEFLTAIGVAVLVAGHRLWPESGLLWRTGLVCAAMKSVSPSAVILGPMFAISAEGLLAETGVRLLGGNIAGYALAGGLAMCGTLAYKLLRMFMVYGPDTIKVYLRGVEWLNSLGMSGLHGRELFFAVLFTYFCLGILASLAGMTAGRNKGPVFSAYGAKPGFKKAYGGKDAARTYSAAALAAHIAFVAAVMAGGRKIPVWALPCAAAAYAYLCSRSYPRARSLLRRAGLWGGVLSASLLAGLILGSAVAGLYMALRAFILTMGFAAIGEELLNPRIRGLMEQLAGRVFFETLEYAFSSLPGMIASLPSGRDFARSPLAALGSAVARAPFLLDAIGQAPVFIITGGHGSGKSELVMELARLLRASGKKPGGICAAGLWENGVRSGFDLVNLISGERTPLCRRGEQGNGLRTGEFGFYSEGLAAGEAALSAKALSGSSVVFIDEIGFLELEGKGWASRMDELTAGRTTLVIAVRDYLLDRVRERWKLRRSAVWRTGEVTAQAALLQLHGFIMQRPAL